MSLKIAITGSSGLVGQALMAHFRQEGHAISRVTRNKKVLTGRDTFIQWNIDKGEINTVALENHDVIIHLAGCNIAGKKWSNEYKEEIYNSRIKGTNLLVNSINKLSQPPKLLITASAVGYYGNHDADKILTEDSPSDDSFLSKVCVDWEQEAKRLENQNIRVCNLRFGVILSKDGGALEKMLTPFSFGLGGNIGNGEQMMSWISLAEIPLIVDFIVKESSLSGPINVVAPNPATNKDFTKALGRAIGRPTILPMPGFAVKMLFGEMGNALLLGGAKVLPKKLLDAGYKYRLEYIDQALEFIFQ